MRNAISLLEQLNDNGNISFAQIQKTQGLSSEQEIQSFSDKLFLRDSSLLSDFENMMKEGRDMKHFILNLSYRIQDKIKEDIIAGRNISESLQVLEILQESLAKAKNSFDSNLVYMI